MKNFLIICLTLFIVNQAQSKGNKVPNGKINDDFKIVFKDQGITLEPNKTFDLENLGLKEYSEKKAPHAGVKFGQERNRSGAVLCGAFFWIFPLDLLFLIPGSHLSSARKTNKMSSKITIIKPDGKKYNAKIAFFRVKQDCAGGVGSYYSISIPNDKFESLKNGSISSFSQYEYCTADNCVSWVIYDVKEQI